MSIKYRLVLDTLPMTFTLVEGSEAYVRKEHKKWLAKIKKTQWVDLPSDTPATINTQLLIALRVVALTAQDLEMEQKISDPRTKNFLDRASNFGTDLVDQGYK